MAFSHGGIQSLDRFRVHPYRKGPFGESNGEIGFTFEDLDGCSIIAFPDHGRIVGISGAEQSVIFLSSF